MAEEALQYPFESPIEDLDEDTILLRRARDDADAAGRLFDKYYDAILGYIYRCTFNQTIAEDLTSNVFLAAFRHLGRFQRRPIRFRAWLYQIATNEVRMHYRRDKRIRRLGRQIAKHKPEAAPAASDVPTACEEYRLLHEALLLLKPKYRTAIALRYFEGKTIAEIAEITGRKEGTLRCQLHRGLAQLQDILSRNGVLPD